MAYKYFTEQLLNSDLDFTQVLPKSQEESQMRGNVSYTFFDILLYLKEHTDNFTKWSKEYEDMDIAVKRIITKYYESEKKDNPFAEKGKKALQTFVEGSVPKEGVVLKDGTVKGRGTVKPAPPVAVEEVVVPEVVLPEEVPTPVSEEVQAAVVEIAEVKEQIAQIDQAILDKLESLKKELVKRKQFLDEFLDTPEEKEDFIAALRSNMEMEREMGDEGDELFKHRAKLLEEFIEQNK